MAHEIDNTTGKNAMAYVGETPWHGLGQRLSQGADIETWRVQAGLDWEVKKGEISYGEGLTFPSKKVLYRSDTQAPLSVVSTGYKIVQPADVLDFFGELSEASGFTLETAGALHGGKKIWGLAKVNDGDSVIGHDMVKPYVLLATSFDGSLATTAKFTTVRVVCNNTLSMARGEAGGIRINHSQFFDPSKVKDQLGIVPDVFNTWMAKVKKMAETPLTYAESTKFAEELLIDHFDADEETNVRKTALYRRILQNYENGIGVTLTEGYTKWRMLNAVTETIDWQGGRGANQRMQSAWFGNGSRLKDKAFDLLTA